MTTVTPPPPAPPPPAPAPAVPVTVTAPQPPPALLNLALGARLEGLVQAVDANAQKLLVQTSVGTLSLLLPAPMPISADARLMLQLAALSPAVQLFLLSVDGEPPPATRPWAAHAPPAGAPAGTPAAPTATDRVIVGTVMQAMLLRPTAVTPPAPAPNQVHGSPAPAPVPLPQATPPDTGPAPTSSRPAALAALVANRLSAVVPDKVVATVSSWFAGVRAVPAAAPTPGRAPVALDRAATTTDVSSPSRPAPAAPGASQAEPVQTPPRGTMFAVRVNPLHGPATPPPASGALAPGQTLLATVVSSTPGQTVVETQAGTLSLKTPAVLPKGMSLALEITGPVRPPETDAAPASPLSSRGWPALEEAVPILHREAPDLHRALITQLLPKPDSTLAAGIILFLTALRAGELRAWLGEDIVRALNRGRPDLLRRIEGDFRELSRLAGDTDGGEWRVAVIPLNAQSAIDQARLLTRRPPRDEPGADADRTRFVLDVTLSHLGRIQLDGLVRRKDKRLDLMVRTATPLPDAMRNDIRRLFAQASETTGINGLIQFEARENGFIEVRTAAPPRDGFVA